MALSLPLAPQTGARAALAQVDVSSRRRRCRADAPAVPATTAPVPRPHRAAAATADAASARTVARHTRPSISEVPQALNVARQHGSRLETRSLCAPLNRSDHGKWVSRSE